jgi:rubrerythrin
VNLRQETDTPISPNRPGKKVLCKKANIEGGRMFKREQRVTWRCRNCGYLFEGTEPPEMCPACAHPQAHFEILGENW